MTRDGGVGRKRNKEHPSRDAIAALPPPPEELEDELMVEGHPEVARLSRALPDGALQLPPPLQVRYSSGG